MKLIRRLLWSAFRIVATIAVGFALLCGSYFHVMNRQVNQWQHVQDIYTKLVIATGRSGEVPTLIIVDEPVVNAYTDGFTVVIYQGMLDTAINDDAIALILGHEIAHVLLGHTLLGPVTPVEQQKREAMADIVGAFYMMKAGYDVCSGREVWKNILVKYGDNMGGDHPDHAYRYSELNVQCSAQ